MIPWSNELFYYIIVGFFAQIIDGSLGMAYGVTSTTLLLSRGISPVMASANVHTAELFTTAASAISHLTLRNVNLTLFASLLFPGMVGGAVGAYILTQLDGKKLTPYFAGYLLLNGLVIIYKSFRTPPTEKPLPKLIILIPLGLVGGFLDAIGGGGWGPFVTSTLIASGEMARFVIGAVNSAEFFVTCVQTLTFYAVLKMIYAHLVLGLVIGGLPAAPLAALLCRRIPPKKLMLLVGVLIVLLSLRTIYLVFK